MKPLSKPTSETTLSANKEGSKPDYLPIKPDYLLSEPNYLQIRLLVLGVLKLFFLKEYLSCRPVCLCNRSGQYLEKTH